MRISQFLLAMLGICGVSSLVHAQAVQLPTFSFFTVNTTVSVPDGGSAFLGGVNSAASGSTEYGTPLAGKLPGVGRLFRNDAMASRMSTSRASVSATIIDLEEMDRAVLGAAAAQRMAAGGGATALDPALGRKATFLAQNLGRAEPETRAAPVAAPPSVAELTERREVAARVRATEAADYFAKAQEFEAIGKAGVAKIYYQMAAARATGDLLVAAQARLAALNSSGSVARGE